LPGWQGFSGPTNDRLDRFLPTCPAPTRLSRRNQAGRATRQGYPGRVLPRGDGPCQSRALQGGRHDRHQAGGAWLLADVQQLTPPLGKRKLREYRIAKLPVQVAMNATET